MGRGNRHASFVQCPYKLRGGLGALSAETVNVLDNQHFTRMQSGARFKFKLMKLSAFRAIVSVKRASAFIHYFILEQPTLAFNELPALCKLAL